MHLFASQQLGAERCFFLRAVLGMQPFPPKGPALSRSEHRAVLGKVTGCACMHQGCVMHSSMGQGGSSQQLWAKPSPSSLWFMDQ